LQQPPRRDHVQATLGIEDVRERQEVELVGSPAVVED
jgi:hypothetical protein